MLTFRTTGYDANRYNSVLCTTVLQCCTELSQLTLCADYSLTHHRHIGLLCYCGPALDLNWYIGIITL